MSYPLANSFSPNLTGIQFTLEKLVYFPMRNFNPMPLRPYVFNAQADAMETLGRRLQEANVGKVTPAALSGITAGLVTPSTVPYGSVIDAGWVGQPRYLFMMKVSHVEYTGVTICSYFFGYTEFNGISTMHSSANIDLDMTHYVNNVIDTSVHTFQTPLGTVRTEKLQRFYNTIYSQQGFGNATVHTQRPTDIYNAIQANEMASVMATDQFTINALSTTGMVSPFSNNVVSSTSENGIASDYLARLLTGAVQATKNREIHVNSYQTSEDMSSSHHFVEQGVAESTFLRYLSRQSGYQTVSPMFTMNNLMTVDSTIYNRFEVFELTNDFASPVLSATPEVGEFWHGQDMVTCKANSLLENCVGLATKYGFQVISFKATNMAGPMAGVTIGVLDFNSFLSLSRNDFAWLVDIFKAKFESEIFINETNGGTVPLNMECHVNMLGASKIYLEYAGFPGVWYTAPTFASSLYSPVVTATDESLSYAASQVSRVVNTLLDAQPMIYS